MFSQSCVPLQFDDTICYQPLLTTASTADVNEMKCFEFAKGQWKAVQLKCVVQCYGTYRKNAQLLSPSSIHVSLCDEVV